MHLPLDLDMAIHSKMRKTEEGFWQCCDCLKTSKVKTNIYEHIEASHMGTLARYVPSTAEPETL